MKSIKEPQLHTEDIKDIISTPPSWLLRWGILLVLFVFSIIVLLSAFIRYPDVVQTTIRINAANAPKQVVGKVSGNIVRLLVSENDQVEAGQDLAWMESTANHLQVLTLQGQLEDIRINKLKGDNDGHFMISIPTNMELGELQNTYQTFYQSYLNYRATAEDGIFVKRKSYLHDDLKNIKEQREQLILQQKTQQQEFALAEIEIGRFEKLAESKVISASEYEKQQSIFIGKQYPLQQTQFALLSNDAAYNTKIKELADLENQIREERSSFMQALNSLISEIDRWKSQYVLSASQSGFVVYAGVIQENQHIDSGQEIFYINPGSTDFFGEINIPQYNMGKVKEGQEVLIKLNSFPFQEYGMLKGTVKQVSSIPMNDSLFISQVMLHPSTLRRPVTLKTGMSGSAEIITQDLSLLSRLYQNMNKLIDISAY